MLTIIEDTTHEDATQRGWWVGYEEDGTFDAASGPYDTQAEAQEVADRANAEDM